MSSTKKLWFRITSSALAALTTFFFSGQELSQAHAATRRADVEARRRASVLNIPVERLTAPEVWAKREALETARRREQALKAARAFAGGAQQSEREATQAATSQQVMKARPVARLERALATGRAQRAGEAKLRAAALKAAPDLQRALAAPRKVRTQERRMSLPPPSESKPMPKPRLSPGDLELGTLSPELSELYASVTGEDVEVELPDGSLAPVEELLAAGFALSVTRGAQQRQFASLFTDIGIPGMAMGALAGPALEDLAETPETRRTPEVVALAASLGNSPVALFNYVHLNVLPELYYGSRKGAAATLSEGRGNDFDQASLLIALFRASNIPARYEYGTVRLSKEQALSLTGATTLAAAASMLARRGPAQLTEDGAGVLAERAWVRAYVGYSDYRGTGAGGQKLWVRLDPGLKRIAYTQAVDVKGLVQFDLDGYLSQLRSDTPREAYEAQLLAAAKAQNLCNTLDDAVQKAQMADDPFRLLPAEHPAPVLQSLMVFARPPASMRHFVELDVDGQRLGYELAELQGRTLAVRYPGATASDDAAIQSAGGIENVVPYQVNVAPSVRLDGVEVARLSPLYPGTRQSVTLRVTAPQGNVAVGTSELVAGGSYALWVNGGLVPTAIVAQRQKAIGSAQPGDIDEAKAQMALAWFGHESETAVARMFALEGHTYAKEVQLGMAGRRLAVTYEFGLPVALSQGAYVLDITRADLTPLARDGSSGREAALKRLSGYNSSALEHKAWETVLSAHAISSVRVLQAAASQQVPVYTLTPEDSGNRSLLTGYSTAALNDIDQALAAKWKVRVPKHPINYQDIPDAEGYVLENPVDGTGTFRIGSMLNGGMSGGTATGSSGSQCPPCGRGGEKGSFIDLADGSMRESWTDLTLPAVGIPIVWARTYGSQATGMTELGYGWMHSYGMHLRPELDGSLTYVTDDWREVRFTPNGTNWVCAPGWHMTLTNVTGGGHKLRSKDGVEQTFDADGKLIQIREPGGNVVEVVRQSGLIHQVKDASGSVALSFTYAGNKVASVTDRAGRTVRYAHNLDDLTGYTDVLGHTETYAYERHNLVRWTDKRGETKHVFYDALDRWAGIQDALGHTNAAFYDVPNRRAVFVDKTGRTRTWEFNGAGNPVAVTDGAGNRTAMTWDAAFNKTSETDARGFTTVLGYDARGNLLKRTDADARVTSYTYDTTFNRVLTVAGTGMATVTNTYDTAGRLKSRTDGLGTTSYAYDTKGQLQSVTQPGPATTRFTYKKDGTLETVTDPTNRVTTLGYDGAGHLTSVTDGNQAVRTMALDAAGRVTAMVDPLQSRTEFTYDAAGNRLTATDGGGYVTAFEYDAMGRLVKTTEAKGGVTRTEYDAEGRVVATIDARGGRTEVAYDAAGRAQSTKSPGGSETAYAYCANVGGSSGEPCAVVDAVGNLTTKTFDAVGRTLQHIDGLGRPTTYTYDTAGRVKTTSGPNQPDTTYSYLFSGLLHYAQTPKLTVQYQYDARGNRTQVTAGNGVTKYTYDLANRLLTETNPLSKVTTYTYDGAGNRATKLDANGNLTTYTYDAARQLRDVAFQDGTRYEYGYDARGNRTLERSPTHERLFAHDELGRISTVTDVTLGRSIGYAYDATGNRTSLSEGGVSYGYAYDVDGRLMQVTDGAGRKTAFKYDALGRRTGVLRPNGVRTSYSYDAAHQVQDILHERGGAVLLGFRYGYDEFGNRISKKREDGTEETYGYDSDRRLTDVMYGGARSVTYTLDALGNRTGMTETTVLSGGSTSTKSTSYSNNFFNQLVSRFSSGVTTAYAYDNNGNLLTETTGTQVKSYTWDLDNRLRQVTMPTGAAATYEYDANGLRTKKVESGVETRFLLDGPSVLTELDSLNATTTRYLTNPQVIDEIVSFEQRGTAYYPLGDGLGSVVAITDAAGAVVRSNSYDVYGERTVSTGTGPEIAFGFTGREHDATGLNYHRDRYMNPVVGRWNQPDRLGMVDGPNTYDYVRSNPVAYVDPLGFIRIVPLNSVEAAMLSMIIHRQYGQLIDFMKAMGWGAMRGGREVQAVVGKLVNEGTARIVSSSGTAAYRVPDWLSQSRQLLVELKFVNPCNLRVTNQIRDMADWAAKNNYGMTLIVRQSEQVHPKVMQALAQLNVKVVELNQFVQKELETIKIVVE